MNKHRFVPHQAEKRMPEWYDLQVPQGILPKGHPGLPSGDIVGWPYARCGETGLHRVANLTHHFVVG